MFKYSAHCGPKGERTPARGRHQHQHSKNRIVRLTSSLPSLLETGLPGEKASKRNMSFKPDVLTQFQGWWFQPPRPGTRVSRVPPHTQGVARHHTSPFPGQITLALCHNGV